MCWNGGVAPWHTLRSCIPGTHSRLTSFQAATDLTESLHNKALPQRSIAQRLLRFWPYFQSAKAGIVLAAICSVVGALTEPLIPALL
jgi:hypothetical protein